MKDIKQVIGQKISESGDSLSKLERKGGLSRGVLWPIVNNVNSNPTEKTLRGIAEALGCSVDDLYAESNNTKNNAKESIKWSGILFAECIIAIDNIIKQKGFDFSKSITLNLVEILYKQSIEEGVIDKKIAEILVIREGQKI